MSKEKFTSICIGQIEVGTEIGAGGIRWPLTEVAVTCQKTGFQQIVKSAFDALEVATRYAKTQKNGYVYRGSLPTDYAKALVLLPRS